MGISELECLVQALPQTPLVVLLLIANRTGVMVEMLRTVL